MNKLSIQELKILLSGIQFNVLLKNYTTFRIGGRAKYFFEAKSKEDLIKAILTAKKINLPFFILGKGSNVLASDKKYKGLIINFQFSIFNFKFQYKKCFIWTKNRKSSIIWNSEIRRKQDFGNC